MPYRLVQDGGYVQGVVKDIPPWMLPQGALADATNLLFDQPGIARQRQGTTALLAGGQTGFCTTLGWAYSQDASPIEELYGVNGRDGTIYSVNKTTGGTTLIGTTGTGGTLFGRPRRHFGFVAFPSTVARRVVFLGGQTSTTSFSTASGATITANNPQITLGGSDTTTNLRVGGLVVALSASVNYIGRIVSIDSSTVFTVWPTPSTSFTTSTLTIGPTIVNVGGSCATSFQNRLLLGNCIDLSTSAKTLINDRRIYYSTLPTESAGATGPLIGASFASPQNWPIANFVDIPGADSIVAMEPVSDNELLILTGGTPWVMSGQLATQTTAQAPGLTTLLSPLNSSANCLSDLSVQRTPQGVVWASSEGVFLYTGSGRAPEDLTKGRYHTAWRDLTHGGNFAVHGSFYSRNHYVVSGASAGSTFCLAFNLANQTWAPLSGVDVFYGSPRPTASANPDSVYAALWWNQNAGAPTFTGGQVVRVDSIFGPDTWGQSKADSNGNTINFTAITRSITDDLHTQCIVRRVGCDYQMQAPGANVSVSAGTRIDWRDTAGNELVTLGSLSNTSVLTITGATNATPIVVTTSAAHGLQSGDHVDIHGVGGNTAANGHFRIVVLSTTTFSLDGSRGNGAYTSGGDAKKVTTSEFDGSSMDIGQATYLLITNTGTVHRFELHGTRIGALEFARGMGR